MRRAADPNHPPVRKRFLNVLHEYDPTGGTSLFSFRLQCAVGDRHSTALCYPTGDRIVFDQGDGTIRCYPGALLPRPAPPFHHPVLEDSFHRILTAFVPDVIHFHHFMNWPISVLERAIRSGWSSGRSISSRNADPE
jgi:hypothetical protein